MIVPEIGQTRTPAASACVAPVPSSHTSGCRPQTIGGTNALIDNWHVKHWCNDALFYIYRIYLHCFWHSTCTSFCQAAQYVIKMC